MKTPSFSPMTVLPLQASLDHQPGGGSVVLLAASWPFPILLSELPSFKSNVTRTWHLLLAPVAAPWGSLHPQLCPCPQHHTCHSAWQHFVYKEGPSSTTQVSGFPSHALVSSTSQTLARVVGPETWPLLLVAVLQNPHTSSSCSDHHLSPFLPPVRTPLTWNSSPGALAASWTFPPECLAGFSTMTHPKLCSQFPCIPQISSSWVFACSGFELKLNWNHLWLFSLPHSSRPIFCEFYWFCFQDLSKI